MVTFTDEEYSQTDMFSNIHLTEEDIAPIEDTTTILRTVLETMRKVL
jgi:hypothetical protein